jgi:hypothetical protein
VVCCSAAQSEVGGSSAPAAERGALSRLRRRNGARAGPLSGGRRRRPNPSMERHRSAAAPRYAASVRTRPGYAQEAPTNQEYER